LKNASCPSQLTNASNCPDLSQTNKQKTGKKGKGKKKKGKEEIGQFDRVVSVMGNSHFHLEIFRLLMRYGGPCIEPRQSPARFNYQLIGPDHAMEIAGRSFGARWAGQSSTGWIGNESILEGDVLATSRRARSRSLSTREERHASSANGSRRGDYLPFSVYLEWRQDELAPKQSGGCAAKACNPAGANCHHIARYVGAPRRHSNASGRSRCCGRGEFPPSSIFVRRES